MSILSLNHIPKELRGRSLPLLDEDLANPGLMIRKTKISDMTALSPKLDFPFSLSLKDLGKDWTCDLD